MTKKEGKSMSFVAMIHNQNGIVAIADSKSTNEYSNGYRDEEIGRNTKKIFTNNNFILLTHGKNEIDLPNNNYIQLEECIEEILKENTLPNIFINQLYEYIVSHQRNDKSYCFNFIIGYNTILDNYKRFISYCVVISNKGLEMSPYNIKNGIIAGGCHSQIVENLIINNNWSIEDMKSKLLTLMDISIKLEESFNTYSAVGGIITTAFMDTTGNIETNIE